VAMARPKFVGSNSSLFRNQIAADIFWEYVWTVIGQVHRIAHVCVTYGISVIVVQVGDCPAQGVLPQQWGFHAGSLVSVTVNDQGPAHMNVHGAPPNLPNANQINHGPNAFYIVCGNLVMAKPVPWHHRVSVRLNGVGDGILHYHKHAPREGHGPPPPILPKDLGSHMAFTTLSFCTQVQNFRTAEGVIENVEWD
ncbi:hypothetical protein C8T65DRAFT_588543, partial [Cerioporus squamosus]